MTAFTDDQVAPDFGALYRDESAPKDVDPVESLYNQLTAGRTPITATTPTAPAPAPTTNAAAGPSGAPTAPRTGPATGPAAAPRPASPASPSPAASPMAGQVSPEAVNLLERLKPLGITSLDQLKSKTDVQLRKLSTDVLSYENRQKALNQYFKKNPDGSFDFSIGPDGLPTGLDAHGKVISSTPAAPAQPKAPAQAPAKAATAAPRGPRARAASKVPARKRAVTPKKRSTAPPKRPTKKAVTRKPAPRPVIAGNLRGR